MKLFFSYGHDNHSEVVYRLAKKIEALDKEIDVWIDTDKIPRDSHWRNKITTGIIGSNSVIAFLSSYSAREESVCRDELSIALCSKHGMIKTILLEPANSFTPSSIVTEYQWGDMSNYPDYLDQGEEAFDQYIEAEAKKIIRLVKSDEIQKYDREIRELRELLGLPETDVLTRFDKLLGSEIVGRTWLFEKIKAWAEDTEGSQIMMLYGKPGAGKSMFAAHLQMYEPHVIAAFPCDCRSSEFSRTDSIIRNIAYRLALRMPDYRSVLLNILRKRPNYNDENMMFNLLIATPLAKYNIDGGRETQIIIVDALDEMKNDHLAQFIDQYAPMMKRYVRFLITSRKIPEVTERFNNYSSIDIDAYTSAGKADLKAYYEKRLGEALAEYPEKDAFIQKLIEASELMFAYARCVCDNILADIAEGRFRIHEYPIPKGLNKLYMATLDRYFNSSDAPYTFQDYEDNWQEALGMIAASPEPMPISTLMKLMGWGKNALKRFCRPLSALLVKTGETLQLFHRSFIEWLNTTDCGYASSVEDGIGNLADRCYAVYEKDAEELDAYMLLYTTKFCREAKRKKQYEALKDDDSYVMRVIEHAEHLREMEHAYSYAMKFYEELLCVFDKVDFLSFDEWREFLYIIIIDGIGACYDTTNNFHMAMQYYHKDLEISKQLKDTYPEDPYRLHCYAISLDQIARIYRTVNQLDDALKCYRESFKIRKQLIKDYDYDCNMELFPNDYSMLLEEMAGIYKVTKQFNNAFRCCQEAFEIKKQLKDAYPQNPDHLYEYLISLERLAEIYEKMNQLDDALRYCQEAFEITNKLKSIKDPNHNFYLRSCSESLEVLVEIYKIMNQLDNALRCCQEDLEIRNQLKDAYPQNSDYLYEYSISLVKLAGIYEAMNQLDDALQYYQESFEIRKQLKDAYPQNPNYLYGYSISFEKLAGIYETMNQLNDALRYYQEAFEIRKQLKDVYPQNPNYLRVYSVSLNQIAGIYEAMNQLDNALRCCQEDLKIRNQLKDTYPQNPDYLCEYSISLESLAGIYVTMNQLDDALQYYQEAFEISKQLKDAYPENPGYLRDYSVALNQIAGIYEAMNQLDDALQYYQEETEIFRQLKDAYPQNSNYLHDYLIALDNISELYEDMNQLDNANKYRQEALKVKKLLQSHNT